MRKVEILAPAGSYDSIRAAVHSGCDAVYVGGSRFGARAFADNLTEEKMCEAIDFVHTYGKKLYMTVNTLVKEEEMELIYDFLRPYYEQGLDAAIVQDLGVLKYIHQQFPELPLHASTQMTLHGPYGLELLKEYGATRLVPARELSLEEIRAIRGNTDMELECFVHGALCYCYSGQCLMSSMIGGRSGNRGRCAQPCRTAYELTRGGKKSREPFYALSPKDICTLDLIPDMIKAGIDSFKIEGRMKRPEYSGLTANLYRKYADLYLNKGREGFERWIADHNAEYKEDKTALMDLYNRGGFSEGYYENYHGRKMMSMNRPNHSGVKVGKVRSVKGSEAAILLTEDIYAQDVLEFRRDGKSGYEYTRKDDAAAGSTVTARFKPGSDVQAGDLLYRTRRNELLDRIGEQWLKDVQIPVKGRLQIIPGQPMELTVTCRDTVVSVQGAVAEEAMKQPLTEESAARTMDKTGRELFCFEELTVNVQGNVFQTVGSLKELRRETFARLQQKLTEGFRRKSIEKLNKKIRKLSRNSPVSPVTIPIEVQVSEFDQLQAVLGQEQVSRVFLPLEWEREELRQAVADVQSAGKEAYLAFARMCRERELTYYEQEAVRDDSLFRAADGYLSTSMETVAFLKRHDLFGKGADSVILDHSLYIFNEEAAEFWKEQGFERFTAPLELNSRELRMLDLRQSSFVIYGHLTLMVSAQCVMDNRFGCTGVPEVMELRDVQKRKFYVKDHCRFCYNEILNGDPLWLGGQEEEIAGMNPAALRFVFTVESSQVCEKLLREYFSGGGQAVNLQNQYYTKGHFARGVE